MARKKLDLTNRRFGRLVVVGEAEPYVSPSGNKIRRCDCKCDCGRTTIVYAGHLTSGNTKSCGSCYNGLSNERIQKHGKSNTRLYHIWCTMRERCRVKPEYSHVSVCEEWQKFEPFYEWSMSHGYADNLTIDRIDNNGNYEPSNCRWATWTQQMNNVSKNRKVTFHGVTCTIAEWSRMFCIPYHALRYRIEKGWDFERALTTPTQGELRKARSRSKRI